MRVFNWTGLGDATTLIGANAQFFVPMRTSATVTKITGSTLSWRSASADNSSTTWTFSSPQVSNSCVWFEIGSVTGITAGQAINNRCFGTDIVEASAEL